ncbi:unnamed protein product (macronuclear) [Paramecium tetraurelia]|uniref:Protein kinase domain-containing protein n=1 Tax=Paramecium tetraurelia TaxID=5888 RepID=A0BDZ8_PARTE|nr:uncharacterized protein GSPATT00027796001 [Paramecium tetraurelia]CAK56765.1 unnamed protein product [Paramecium tetraurelia]|eukprot:XP_001424163.1 hypothetical protein (macronuclear) [Paramecium tetraurelia strain d4-2]
MGNCFNQEETHNSSLKRITKIESRISQDLQDSEGGKISLKEFLSQGVIGRGQFGKVLKVKMKLNQKEYAMKAIKKQDIINYGLVENTMLEKKVLEYSNNPFVIRLQYSFQTENKLYLVMDLVNGGQLLKIINKQPYKRFSLHQAQFCTAEVVLGLEYLHDKLKVIYRDLKPENVLVTDDGHLKLTDFGLSKQYESDSMKFFTIAGTPEYLAPEIISNSGHNHTVDLWCLGIFIYEMLTGRTPFRDEANNTRNVEKKIAEGAIEFPDYLNEESQDIILKLLNKNPDQRLGHKSTQDIKDHAFFRNINWDDVANLKTKSPLLGLTPQPCQTTIEVAAPKKILETPQSQEAQTEENFEGFSVNHGEF